MNISDEEMRKRIEAHVASEEKEKLGCLRDEFAMEAMKSIIMLEGVNQKPESCDRDLRLAYMYADSALRVRVES